MEPITDEEIDAFIQEYDAENTPEKEAAFRLNDFVCLCIDSGGSVMKALALVGARKNN